MDTFMDIELIILGVLTGIFIISLVILIISMNGYFKSKQRLTNASEMAILYRMDNECKNIAYTKELIEFIKTTSTQMSIIRFNEYMNSKDVTKATLRSTKNLIHDISTEVYNSIDWSNIKTTDSYMKDSFYKNYIINIVTHDIDKLLKESLNERH